MDQSTNVSLAWLTVVCLVNGWVGGWVGGRGAEKGATEKVFDHFAFSLSLSSLSHSHQRITFGCYSIVAFNSTR